MTIAFDADEMEALRLRLSDSAGAAGGAVPMLPGGSAFGSADLAAAVVAFDTAVRRDVRELEQRWSALATGVRQTVDEFDAVENVFATGMQQMAGEIG